MAYLGFSSPCDGTEFKIKLNVSPFIQNEHIIESLNVRIPKRPLFRFVQGTFIDGKKFRVVANKIYITSLNGTFYQFFEQHTIELIGGD